MLPPGGGGALGFGSLAGQASPFASLSAGGGGGAFGGGAVRPQLPQPTNPGSSDIWQMRR